MELNNYYLKLLWAGGAETVYIFKNVEDLAVNREPEKGVNKGWVGQVCNQVGDSHLPKCWVNL